MNPVAVIREQLEFARDTSDDGARSEAVDKALALLDALVADVRKNRILYEMEQDLREKAEAERKELKVTIQHMARRRTDPISPSYGELRAALEEIGSMPTAHVVIRRKVAEALADVPAGDGWVYTEEKINRPAGDDA